MCTCIYIPVYNTVLLVVLHIHVSVVLQMKVVVPKEGDTCTYMYIHVQENTFLGSRL